MNNGLFRHEFKYLITQSQVDVIKMRMSGVMKPDTHTGENGVYNICSLYFDDYYNRCYYENLSGVDPREKYRIRIYNHDTSRISLECKRKERGKTLKTSCIITEDECKQLMSGNVNLCSNTSPVFMKFQNEIRLRGMRPVIVVEYERIPYVYSVGNVRVTLDTNLSSSSDIDGFLNNDMSRRPVMPAGMQLLEVKYNELLPDFIYKALQIDNLTQTAFSKYFLCRKFNMR